MKFVPVLKATAIVACVLAATGAAAFDRETVAALSACQDYLWDVPDYSNLPNAAISVWPASVDGNVTKIYWAVDWTDPDVKAAGQCGYAGGEVINFEQFN